MLIFITWVVVAKANVDKVVTCIVTVLAGLTFFKLFSFSIQFERSPIYKICVEASLLFKRSHENHACFA